MMDTTLTTDCLLIIGKTSLVAAVLVCVVMMIQGVTRRWLSPFWCYALSGLVVIRLLIPGSVESSYGLFPGEDGDGPVGQELDYHHPAEAETRVPLHPGEAVPVLESPTTVLAVEELFPDEAAVPATPPLAVIETLEAEEGSPPVPGGAESGITWVEALTWIWLSGVALLLSSALFQHLRLWWFVRNKAREPSGRSEFARELLESCRKKMRVRREVRLIEVRGFPVPAVFGFLRPAILLPEDSCRELGEDELRHILLHELAHVRRNDVAVNWVLIFLRALHWFNPLIWIGLRRFLADRETLRDDQVLDVLTESERTSYGQTLLKLVVRLQSSSGSRLAGSVVPFLTKKQEIKRRILMISEKKVTNRAGTLFALVAGTALCFAAFTIRAQDVGPEPTAKPTAKDPATTEAASAEAPDDSAAKSSGNSGVSIIETATTSETRSSGLSDERERPRRNKIVRRTVEIEATAGGFGSDELLPGTAAAAGAVAGGAVAGGDTVRNSPSLEELKQLRKKGNLDKVRRELLDLKKRYPRGWSKAHGELFEKVQNQLRVLPERRVRRHESLFGGGDSTSATEIRGALALTPVELPSLPPESHHGGLSITTEERLDFAAPGGPEARSFSSFGSDNSNVASRQGTREKNLEDAYRNLVAAGLKEEAAKVRQHLERARKSGKTPAERERRELLKQMQLLQRQAAQVEQQLREIRTSMTQIQARMNKHVPKAGMESRPNPSAPLGVSPLIEEPSRPTLPDGKKSPVKPPVENEVIPGF